MLCSEQGGGSQHEHKKIQVAGTPSCSSGHVSLPLQMLFLQQHPVFQCPLDAQRDPRHLQALLGYRSYFRHRGTAWGLLRCHFPSCFSWIAQVVCSLFSERGKPKSRFTGTSHVAEDGHSSSSCLRAEGWRPEMSRPAGPSPWLCRSIPGSGDTF